jgi:hypothetical protein
MHERECRVQANALARMCAPLRSSYYAKPDSSRRSRHPSVPSRGAYALHTAMTPFARLGRGACVESQGTRVRETSGACELCR